MIKDNDHNSDLFSNNKKLFFFSNILLKRILPNLLLNIPMTVFSAATLRSQIKASSIPPATACPSIAPITGLLSFSREGPLKHGERERLLNMEGPWMEEGEVGLLNEQRGNKEM